MEASEPGWLRRQVLRHRAPTEFLQTAIFRSGWVFHKPVLAALSPPRTGSVAVVRALRRAIGHPCVLHLHYMNPRSIAENRRIFEELHRKTGLAGLHREYLGARLLEAYRARPGHQRIRLVAVVRDPMARTVSAFFRQFTLDYPGMQNAFLADANNLPQLREMFFAPAETQKRVTLEWFDTEVKAVFGVDVFAQPFPREQGWKIYEGADCDLLVLRLEDAKRAGPEALAKLIGHPAPIPIAVENTARDEDIYAENYKRFIDTLRVPAAYLNNLYDSALARHFYTPAEIAAMRARWQPAGGQ